MRFHFDMSRWWLAILVCAVIAAGCSKKETEEVESSPLARVGGVAITEEDFALEVQRRQAAGRPLSDAQTVLKEMIERQAMLKKSANSEVMKDPQVIRELENRQLGQWLDRTLQIERDAVRVSDEDIKTHYESNRDAYTRPEMVRLAMLYRKVNPRDPDDNATSLQEELENARAAYLADPAAATQNGRLPGFGTLAAEYSEDHISRYRGGDLGWMEKTDADARIPASVITAGFALDVGAVSDVITAADGLYVVMKSDTRPARITPFEEVAPTLRRKLIRAKQEDVERVFMSNLLADAQVEINQEKAGRLALPETVIPEPPVLRPVSELAPNREAR